MKKILLFLGVVLLSSSVYGSGTFKCAASDKNLGFVSGHRYILQTPVLNYQYDNTSVQTCNNSYKNQLIAGFCAGKPVGTQFDVVFVKGTDESTCYGPGQGQYHPVITCPAPVVGTKPVTKSNL